jgi:hypothetical protein
MPVLLGVHEKTTTSAERGLQYPGHAAARIFSANVLTEPDDLTERITRQCGEAWRSGHTAVWSFKPAPARVFDGTWKQPVQQLARYLYAYRDVCPTIVTIWHEPENDIPRWFATPEEFVTMFNTVHVWLTAIHPDLITCHAAMAYAYRDSGLMDDTQAARWRTLARLNSIDAYSGRSFPLTTILPELSGYARWRRKVDRYSAQWGVTERGWTCPPIGSADRARTIAREFRWLTHQARPPQLYLIWGSSGSEGDEGLALDAAAQTAVRDGFRLLATQTA